MRNRLIKKRQAGYWLEIYVWIKKNKKKVLFIAISKLHFFPTSTILPFHFFLDNLQIACVISMFPGSTKFKVLTLLTRLTAWLGWDRCPSRCRLCVEWQRNDSLEARRTPICQRFTQRALLFTRIDWHHGNEMIMWVVTLLELWAACIC